MVIRRNGRVSCESGCGGRGSRHGAGFGACATPALHCGGRQTAALGLAHVGMRMQGVVWTRRCHHVSGAGSLGVGRFSRHRVQGSLREDTRLADTGNRWLRAARAAAAGAPALRRRTGAVAGGRRALQRLARHQHQAVEPRRQHAHTYSNERPQGLGDGRVPGRVGRGGSGPGGGVVRARRGVAAVEPRAASAGRRRAARRRALPAPAPRPKAAHALHRRQRRRRARLATRARPVNYHITATGAFGVSWCVAPGDSRPRARPRRRPRRGCRGSAPPRRARHATATTCRRVTSRRNAPAEPGGDHHHAHTGLKVIGRKSGTQQYARLEDVNGILPEGCRFSHLLLKLRMSIPSLIPILNLLLLDHK